MYITQLKENLGLRKMQNPYWNYSSQALPARAMFQAVHLIAKNVPGTLLLYYSPASRPYFPFVLLLFCFVLQTRWDKERKNSVLGVSVFSFLVKSQHFFKWLFLCNWLLRFSFFSPYFFIFLFFMYVYVNVGCCRERGLGDWTSWA